MDITIIDRASIVEDLELYGTLAASELLALCVSNPGVAERVAHRLEKATTTAAKHMRTRNQSARASRMERISRALQAAILSSSHGSVQ